jgi:oligosaccharide translocation protein RFT1
MNLGWIATALSIPLAVLTSAIVLLFPPESGLAFHVYRSSIIICAVAAVVEMLSEPIHLYCQRFEPARVRASIDMRGNLARCLVTFGLVVLGHGLTAFAWGQLAYAVVVTLCFFQHMMWHHPFIQNQFNACPHGPESLWASAQSPGFLGTYTEPGLRDLAWSMSLQSVWKFVQTEGEKLVLLALQVR